DAQLGVPAVALVDPELVPLLVGAGLDEELHLHLLELAGAEDEVARRDLVAERLALLADAKLDLLAAGGEHVLVVDEDALRGFRAQEREAALVLDWADVRAQHAVEVPRLGELTPDPAVRAVDVVKPRRRRVAVLLLVRLEEVVGAEAVVAVEALG